MPRAKKSMVEAATTPDAVIVIQFFPNSVEVNIEQFENLTPGKIDRAYPLVQESWAMYQREVLLAQRRAHVEERLNGAENV